MDILGKRSGETSKFRKTMNLNKNKISNYFQKIQ